MLELLIVMAIMAILTALVFASFNTSRERARDNVRISAINNAILGIEQFRSACRNYPANLDDITDPQYCSNDPTGLMSLDNFFAELPKLPFNEAFKYSAEAHLNDNDRCVHYHIAAGLEDVDSSFLEEDDDEDTSSWTPCDNSDSGFDATNDTSDGLYDFYR